MAENIFARVKRIVSGGVEDVVDSMEKAGGEAVMREAIREVDRALDEARAEMGKAAAVKAQAARQIQMVSGKLDELTAKAKFAVEQNRAELAEAAIARQVDLEAQTPILDSARKDAEGEEERLRACVAALAARKREMEADLAAFVAAKREVTTGAVAASIAGDAPDRRVERAQQAFDRGMTGAGGVTGAGAPDHDTAKKLAELETLARRQKINDRISSLKASVQHA